MSYTLRHLEVMIRHLPIKIAWFIYVIVLQKTGGDESHGWAFDKWQHEVIFKIIDNKFVCINRCRSGSKTRDMSALIVFFRIRGLIPYWYASNRKQLIRAQVYWNENPFIKHAPISLQKGFIHLINGTFFQISILKKGLDNDRGPRAHAIFYDEVAGMPMDLIENTRLITGGMDWDGSPLYWIHFSTPKINSSFQQVCSEYPCYTNDCSYPSWFTWDYIHQVKKDLSAPKFRQEMLCEFVSMQGCVFDGQLYKGHCPTKLRDDTYWGMDPNAREGYCLVGWKYDQTYKNGEFVYCHSFGPGAQGKKLMLEFLFKETLTGDLFAAAELETNGVGMPIFDDFLEMDIPEEQTVVGEHWDNTSKIRRVNSMNKVNMYNPCTNKEFRALWNQMNAMSLTASGDKIDKPSDVEWHYADSAMHAVMGAELVWE